MTHPPTRKCFFNSTWAARPKIRVERMPGWPITRSVPPGSRSGARPRLIQKSQTASQPTKALWAAQRLIYPVGSPNEPTLQSYDAGWPIWCVNLARYTRPVTLDRCPPLTWPLTWPATPSNAAIMWQPPTPAFGYQRHGLKTSGATRLSLAKFSRLDFSSIWRSAPPGSGRVLRSTLLLLGRFRVSVSGRRFLDYQSRGLVREHLARDVPNVTPYGSPNRLPDAQNVNDYGHNAEDRRARQRLVSTIPAANSLLDCCSRRSKHRDNAALARFSALHCRGQIALGRNGGGIDCRFCP